MNTKHFEKLWGAFESHRKAHNPDVTEKEVYRAGYVAADNRKNAGNEKIIAELVETLAFYTSQGFANSILNGAELRLGDK